MIVQFRSPHTVIFIPILHAYRIFQRSYLGDVVTPNSLRMPSIVADNLCLTEGANVLLSRPLLAPLSPSLEQARLSGSCYIDSH